MAAASRVPVHIVTGFLGSGKTTLIHSLIEQKPVDEKWAILVNEFGQIGIDQAMFD
ncbi:MAG: GTP-binding protein, partial [Pseudomonadota bacterium]|nr:GTP-binding protein [Pseudomonadota bacterium]